MDLFMCATCCFNLCWNKRKRDFDQRTEAMGLGEGYLLAFPTVIKSRRSTWSAFYFFLKATEGEIARGYTGTCGRVLWNWFYFTCIFCASLNKEGKAEVAFGFEFSWNVQFSLWWASWSFSIRWCVHRMCMQFVFFLPFQSSNTPTPFHLVGPY